MHEEKLYYYESVCMCVVANLFSYRGNTKIYVTLFLFYLLLYYYIIIILLFIIIIFCTFINFNNIIIINILNNINIIIIK